MGEYPLPDLEKNEPLAVFCIEDEFTILEAGDFERWEWWPDGDNSPTLEVYEPGAYPLTVWNVFGCSLVDTIYVESRCEPKVFVPNAFSPNDDDENDFFQVFTDYLGSYEMFVYNRWGEVIFHTTSLEEYWDGRYRGELMPSGVYPWMIRFAGDNPDYQDREEITGKVTLLR